jgi:hypothetical protein
MSAVAATAARITRLRRYRRHHDRVLSARAAYVPPTRYIPRSTADLWRSARGTLAR